MAFLLSETRTQVLVLAIVLSQKRLLFFVPRAYGLCYVPVWRTMPMVSDTVGKKEATFS